MLRYNGKLSSGGDFTLESVTDGSRAVLKLPRGEYKPSASINSESIDASYFNAETMTLYVFQCTVSSKHPVKAMGIINAIEQLSTKPTKTVLVFVIPVQPADFIRQKIDFRYHPSTDMSSDVRLVHGVGAVVHQELIKLGIKTIGELAQKSRDGAAGPYSYLIDNYFKDRALQQEHSTLARVQQVKLLMAEF